MTKYFFLFSTAQGITYEKFLEHRGYAGPGYIPKHPKEGDAIVDGTILSIEAPSDNGPAPSSTLLAECKKLAAANGTSKVLISFDAITCPFARLYSLAEL